MASCRSRSRSSASRLTSTIDYLNNIVEQDHRAVKRVTRPMLGFKSFDAAHDTLVGIELMHMLKKRQLVVEEGAEDLTAADLFYALAA
jgi:putative transposase